jgi:hypothetical protein
MNIMNLPEGFREKVWDAIQAHRQNYGGNDSSYAQSLGINKSVYSTMKKHGVQDGKLTAAMWLILGRRFNVTMSADSWKTVRTPVYNAIENALAICQEKGLSMMLVDDAGIGKTYCAERIVQNMKNAFYVDCSQAKTKSRFIKALATALGVDTKGRLEEIKDTVKYFIGILENPIIVLDEAGDLVYNAFLDFKEIWNANQYNCAWYLMGADGFRKKIEDGFNKKKVGFAEMRSRFSDEYNTIIPPEKERREAFLRKLIGDVATANISDQKAVNRYVNACIKKHGTLRHLRTLIKIRA